MLKKANPFSDNGFGRFEDEEEKDTAPFRDQTVAQADSASWPVDKDGAWGGPSNQPATISLDNGFTSASGSQADQQKRKEQLDAFEKELNAKELKLRKQEEELVATGALKPKKNWPRCYPITRHDINGEVPESNRSMVKYCYWAFLGFFAALTWNWFGSLMAMCVISPGSNRLVGFLLATIYWFAGVPGAWILWYMRIYNVAIRDRVLVYAWFFLAFILHLAFCVWAAISPPLPLTTDWSHTGFVTAIKAFDDDTFVGVVYIIGGVLWSFEALWSLWALKTVYKHFRSGPAPQQMKQEVAGALASHAMSGGKSRFGFGNV